MQIKDVPTTQITKLKGLGDNFSRWFGTVDVDSVPSPLFSTPLPSPMTGRDILKQFNPTLVEIKDIYALVPSLKKSALFLVTDSTPITRVVFVLFQYKSDTQWEFVSREMDAEPWYGDVDIYSLTKI